MLEYMLNQGKELSEFDKARAKNLLKKQPEIVEIMEQVLNTIK